MAVQITGEQVLQAVIQRTAAGMYIANNQMDALAAGSITSLLRLANAQHSSNTYRGLNAGIYRPGAATVPEDYWRTVGDLTATTGVLANSSNWTDITLGTENIYLLYYDLHPVQFLDALNRAMQLCYFQNTEPLSLKPAGAVIGDHGFQSTATTNYVESDADAGPATTFTKVTTTDSDVVWGGSIASGRVLNAAANGYIRQRFNVTRGETIFVWAISRADVGTSGNGASLVLYDISNSALLGTAVSHSEETWQYMWRENSVTSGAAGTEILELRLQGIGASDDIYWGAKGINKTKGNRVALDSTWDAGFKIRLMAATFDGPQTTSGVIPAESMRLVEIPPDEYGFDIQKPGANPRWLQWHPEKFSRDWRRMPVFIQGRRAYSDLTTFSLALTETTACELDLIESMTRVQMFKPGGTASHYPEAGILYAQALMDLEEAQRANNEVGPALRREPATMMRTWN